MTLCTNVSSKFNSMCPELRKEVKMGHIFFCDTRMDIALCRKMTAFGQFDYIFTVSPRRLSSRGLARRFGLAYKCCMIHDSYFANSRPEMLPFVPLSARKVLDLGCGGGLFSESLKLRNGAETWGVECEPRAAALAKGRMDRVFQGDVAQVVDELPEAHFDAIVCNDVLEHLPDPWSLLRAIRPLLAPGGSLVCSIPNVRHFSVLTDLAWRGEWQYADSGPLDRTHLRFFTRRGIQSLFRDTGWRLLQIEGINPYAGWRFRLLNTLALGRFSECRYLQFACVAQPAGPGEP
jgi:2-polyprenyl-3-methyl-5-hydroxy-6-metoxy-1,4-benzoquinol methylase